MPVRRGGGVPFLFFRELGKRKATHAEEGNLQDRGGASLRLRGGKVASESREREKPAFGKGIFRVRAISSGGASLPCVVFLFRKKGGFRGGFLG